MSHEKRHRGPNPKDVALFADDQIPLIRQAVFDMGWLLSKGYAPISSLKIVGDRYSLRERQRLLVMRSSCNSNQKAEREKKRISPDEMAGQDVYIDGFNILITVESALSGGFVFIGNDGWHRDMSSIHGTYKRVSETQHAIVLIGQALAKLDCRNVHWLLDKPVSNSGRLKKLIEEIALANKFSWHVELVKSPDSELKAKNEVTLTADAIVLDAVDRSFNIVEYLIERSLADGKCIDLRTN